MENRIIKCELCGVPMKTRVNGSHLMRKHSITLEEYINKFPNAEIGKRSPKKIKYVCRIDEVECGDSSALSKRLKRFYNMSLEEYYIKYHLNGIRPVCKCGCEEFTTFNNMEDGFHEYIIRHSPVWNKGLTKDTDERIKTAKLGGWSKGLTKFTDDRLKKHSETVKNKWKNDDGSLKERMVESYKNTMIEKYGVDNFSKTDLFIQKFEQTCLEKYGVTNPYFSNKCKWKFKNYTLPSGKIVKLQGYEPFAMNLLLSKYDESKIVTDKELIPKIKYDENGKCRKHCPDLYIPDENILIEVKSNFTFKIHRENCFNKKTSAIKRGFKYKILVFNDDGKLNMEL